MVSATLAWMDEKLTWKPEDYGGIEETLLYQHEIWIPPIIPGNSPDLQRLGDRDGRATIRSSGLEAGERVSFVVTIMLATAVFLTIIANEIPKVSDPIPWSEQVEIGYITRKLVRLSKIDCIKKQDKTAENIEENKNNNKGIKKYDAKQDQASPNDENIEKPGEQVNANMHISENKPYISSIKNDHVTIKSMTWHDVSDAVDRIAFIILTMLTTIGSVMFIVKLQNMKVVPSSRANVEIMTSTTLAWMDEKLTWKPEDYGGIEETLLYQYEIWIPPIIPGNDPDLQRLGDRDGRATIRSNGLVTLLIILPIVGLMVIDSFVYLIPQEAGERSEQVEIGNIHRKLVRLSNLDCFKKQDKTAENIEKNKDNNKGIKKYDAQQDHVSPNDENSEKPGNQKKVYMSTLDVLTFLKNQKVVLQILKDVSKTTSWKPGCLATSITSRPGGEEEPMVRGKGIMGSLPVQHDVVEETMPAKQPKVDECLLTVVGYHDNTDGFSTGRHVSEILGSLSAYIRYRKCMATSLVDMKMPSTNHEKYARSYSSSEDHTAGQKMLLRFRSLVEKPIGAEKLYSMKQQLVRSTSILRHKSPSFTTGMDLPENNAQSDLKTCSLDRRKNMPHFSRSEQVKLKTQSRDFYPKPKDTNTQSDSDAANKNTHSENNNVDKEATVANANTNNNSDASQSEDETGDMDDNDIKDLDRSLEADVDDQEKFEQSLPQKDSPDPSKEGIQHIVSANHTAAELTTVVYLGKGVIQAKPQSVWNAIRNPRTKFAYDDSLKKVDVIEKVSDNIKIVYYYHEVLQLFKTECYDMVVAQSERVDRGDKYILAMQSADSQSNTVATPSNTSRVKVLPSGWIIEPVNKDRKVYSMVTYIMQIEQADSPLGADRTPFEDFIAKQPLGIAYLRQYLKGCLYQK
ncbi:STAR9-like protein [Mya arenaria]|uniref:STAR9-like protein n=1 Tax=Mya arenaria TaxID=6604 RepID=A0ABY7FCF8_MYAAR|nr:STAR9-like protein [Mya arenaria]